MLEALSAVHSGEELLCSQVVTKGRKRAKLFLFFFLVAEIFHVENCHSLFSNSLAF